MTDNKKIDKQIAEALNECFESMLIKNEPIDSCLARYPQHAAELRPLLVTMKRALEASALSPDSTFRARARYEFRNALYDNVSRKTRPFLAWRWATVVSTVGVFLLTSTGGVVAASSSSMPGQPLYQVKRTIEDVQLTLTPSQAAKARLYATLADRRVGEIMYAAQKGDVNLTEDLTRQFATNLSMVSAIIAPSRSLTFGGGSKQAVAPSPDGSPEQSTTVTSAIGATNVPSAPPPAINVVPAPTPTIVAPTPPTVTVTQVAPVPTATFAVPQPTITLSGITDPALLKLLQQYSVKNIAELMSILDKVPPSVKTALLAAIQAVTSGYGQILGT
ncbi:MAG: hypothetical protein C4542_07030 [Dehalococcoidia bacterium]|nr:MAG: hypothetical protein C4542_07030 [Dehalococcoidia bacterium]